MSKVIYKPYSVISEEWNKLCERFTELKIQFDNAQKIGSFGLSNR